MKKISRLFLFDALVVILLTAACAPEEGTPTVVETLPPVDLPHTPGAAVTNTPQASPTTGGAATSTPTP